MAVVTNRKTKTQEIVDLLAEHGMLPATTHGLERAKNFAETDETTVEIGILYSPPGFKRRPWWRCFTRRRRIFLGTLEYSKEESWKLSYRGFDREGKAARRLGWALQDRFKLQVTVPCVERVVYQEVFWQDLLDY